MSGASDRYLESTAERARKAKVAARPSVSLPQEKSAMRRVRVATVGDNGFYTVDVFTTSGAIEDSVPGVRAWGGSFAPGDEAWIVYEGERPVPYLISGGGGGGGSSTGFAAIALIPCFSS